MANLFPQFYSQLAEDCGELQFAYTLPDGATFQCVAKNLDAPASVFIDGELVGRAVTVGNAKYWFDQLKACMERGECTTWVAWKAKYLAPADAQGNAVPQPVNEALSENELTRRAQRLEVILEKIDDLVAEARKLVDGTKAEDRADAYVWKHLDDVLHGGNYSPGLEDIIKEIRGEDEDY